MTFLFFCSCQLYADSLFIVHKSSSMHYAAKRYYKITLLRIENVSDQPIWLWFDKQSAETDKYNYFRTRHEGFSILDLFREEANISIKDFHSKIFETFIKRLNCKECFYVIIFTKELEGCNLDKHIIAEKEDIIEKLGVSHKGYVFESIVFRKPFILLGDKNLFVSEYNNCYQ